MAGLGKREDRHTVEENRYYLSEAREVHGLVKLFLLKLFFPRADMSHTRLPF